MLKTTDLSVKTTWASNVDPTYAQGLEEIRFCRICNGRVKLCGLRGHLNYAHTASRVRFS
jgi:hypothetical protein